MFLIDVLYCYMVVWSCFWFRYCTVTWLCHPVFDSGTVPLHGCVILFLIHVLYCYMAVWSCFWFRYCTVTWLCHPVFDSGTVLLRGCVILFLIQVLDCYVAVSSCFWFRYCTVTWLCHPVFDSGTVLLHACVILFLIQVLDCYMVVWSCFWFRYCTVTWLCHPVFDSGTVLLHGCVIIISACQSSHLWHRPCRGSLPLAILCKCLIFCVAVVRHAPGFARQCSPADLGAVPLIWAGAQWDATLPAEAGALLWERRGPCSLEACNSQSPGGACCLSGVWLFHKKRISPFCPLKKKIKTCESYFETMCLYFLNSVANLQLVSISVIFFLSVIMFTIVIIIFMFTLL